MAFVRRHVNASFAVSVLALAVALGSGAGWAATRQAAPHPSLTCVVVKKSAFRNGWHNLGFPFPRARLCKDSLGLVHLEGVIGGRSGNTPIFVLPSAYRPKFVHLFAVTGTNGGVPVLENVFVLFTGVVVARGNARSAVSLDGVTYPIGN